MAQPFCPRCGAAQDASNLFCPKCGQRLPAEVPGTPPAAAQGEAAAASGNETARGGSEHRPRRTLAALARRGTGVHAAFAPSGAHGLPRPARSAGRRRYCDLAVGPLRALSFGRSERGLSSLSALAALAQQVVGQHQSRPWPPRSAPRAAARRDRGGPGLRASVASPAAVTVSAAACRIVAVGLKATRNTMSSPLLMPPWMPPERLVACGRGRPCSMKASLCSLPREQRAGEAAADLEALRRRQGQHGLGEVGLELVEDRLAQPGGHAAHDALDHAADGIALRRASPRCARSSASRPSRVGAAHDVGLDAAASVTVADGSIVGLDVVDAASRRRRTSTPGSARRSNLRATAPAATRPMVSRALARPPPCQARMPYFAS